MTRSIINAIIVPQLQQMFHLLLLQFQESVIPCYGSRYVKVVKKIKQKKTGASHREHNVDPIPTISHDILFVALPVHQSEFLQL